MGGDHRLQTLDRIKARSISHKSRVHVSEEWFYPATRAIAITLTVNSKSQDELNLSKSFEAPVKNREITMLISTSD